MRIREPFLVNPPRELSLARQMQGSYGIPTLIKRKKYIRPKSYSNKRYTITPMTRRWNPLSVVGLGAFPLLNAPKAKRKAVTHRVKHRTISASKVAELLAAKAFVERKGKGMAKRKVKRVKVVAKGYGPSGKLAFGSPEYMDWVRSKRHKSKGGSVVAKHRGPGRPKGSHSRKHKRGRPKGSVSVGTRSGWSPVHGYRLGHMRILTNPYGKRRSNPAGILSLGGFSFGSMLPLMATAGASVIVTKLVPNFLGATVNNNQWMRYGAQVGSGVLGYMLLSKFLNREHGIVWAASAGGTVVSELLQNWILSSYGTPVVTPTPGTSGMGAFVNKRISGMGGGEYPPGNYPGVRAYPGYPAGVGAFTDPYN